MRLLFKINKYVLITNLVLFLIPPFGMLFMMLLGLFQVVSSVYLLTRYNKISKTVRWMTISHLLLSLFIVTFFFMLFNDMLEFNHHQDMNAFSIGMILSGLTAFYFIFISYNSSVGRKQIFLTQG
ncbi:hypothetical protein [Nonlabens sp. Asnod3-A02]|uniref:Tic20 family protein n=2 Tax=Nonlabens xylanidelens TaxID=191564 RepID=A0A2S6IQ16_9FLAO|nr:hypothetical protein LY01_00044 [Nonlabens xylanidelens]PQJ17969.1 hypothetical protein BST94_08090 [Nonlabens xylanidelens]